MKTAADKAARDQLISLYIEEGSRGAVEAAAVRDQLQKDVDTARAAYMEAATLYGASYEADIMRAADQLQAVRDQLQATRAEIAAARDNIAVVERCGTKEKAAQLRADLQKVKQRAAQLEKAAAEAGAYIPAGDPELLKAAEKADKRWRSEKAKADEIAAGIDKRLAARAADLQRARREIGTGVWSIVTIPAAMRVSELRRKGKKGDMLREILQQREKAAAVSAEIEKRLRDAARGHNIKTGGDDMTDPAAVEKLNEAIQPALKVFTMTDEEAAALRKEKGIPEPLTDAEAEQINEALRPEIEKIKAEIAAEAGQDPDSCADPAAHEEGSPAE